jgi:acetyl-CoA synthetase
VHTHGGFPLKIAHDAAVHFNLGPGDVWLWPADFGWVVGPITVVGALTRGATLICYDGAPDFPDASRLARLIERYDVTHLGASPTLIRGLAAAGNDQVWPSGVDLSSLQLLITAGEVIDEDHFVWFQKSFGQGNRPVINYTGGTEVSGALLASVVTRPIVPTVFNTGSPGIEIDVLDDSGRPIIDHPGELVIRKPFVGMTHGFWDDESRYLETYWNRFTDTWVHGDLAVRISSPSPRDSSSYALLGRSDDTLKIAGKRVGPAEVEAAALSCDAVREAAAIGVDDPRKGQRLILFVVCDQPNPRHPATCVPRSLAADDVAHRIELSLGKPFKPAAIYFVPELPKTRNAKVIRRILKRICNGEPLGDLSALENPSSLDALREAVTPRESGDGPASSLR